MDKNTSDDNSDLLGQLAQLEQKVSKLSSELQARSETIELLERSLNEKRLHILELEAALRVAQQSMLDLAWDNVQRYQQQIWAGISHQLTDPKFAQLRNLMESIRSFLMLIRQFTEIGIIKPGRYFVHIVMENIDAIRGDPTSYYQNTLNVIVSKCHMRLKQINAFFAQFIEEVQAIIDQKVLWPIKNAYEDINEILKEVPSEAGFLLQNKIVRPVWQHAGGLTIKFSKVHIEVQRLIANVRRSVQPMLSRWYNIIIGKIKSFKDTHSSGSSDRGMAGTYA